MAIAFVVNINAIDKKGELINRKIRIAADSEGMKVRGNRRKKIRKRKERRDSQAFMMTTQQQ
jgi:hypothetical protein